PSAADRLHFSMPPSSTPVTVPVVLHRTPGEGSHPPAHRQAGAPEPASGSARKRMARRSDRRAILYIRTPVPVPDAGSGIVVLVADPLVVVRDVALHVPVGLPVRVRVLALREHVDPVQLLVAPQIAEAVAIQEEVPAALFTELVHQVVQVVARVRRLVTDRAALVDEVAELCDAHPAGLGDDVAGLQ